MWWKFSGVSVKDRLLRQEKIAQILTVWAWTLPVLSNLGASS